MNATQPKKFSERLIALGIDTGFIDSDMHALLVRCEHLESENKRIANEAIEVTHDVSARLESTELAIKSLIDTVYSLLMRGEESNEAKIAWLKTMFAEAKREFDARAAGGQ